MALLPYSSAPGSGGGSALWSGLGNPTANLALTMGAYSTQWSYTGGGLIFFSPTGQIGIGTAAPANALDVGTTTAGQNAAIYQTANGAQLAPALTTPNWTMTSGWVYGTSPNVLNKSGRIASSVHPASALPIVAGNTYQVTITASAVTVGSFNYSLGGNISNNFGVPGTYTSTFLAVSTASLSIASVGSTSGFVISAVSVIQVFANTGNLTLGNNILSSSGVQAIGVAANGDVTLYGNSGNYSGGELQLNSGNNPYFIHASNQVQFVAGVQSSGGGSQFAMAGGNSVIAGQQGGAFVNIGGGGYGSGAGGSLQYTGGGGGATGPGGYVNIAGGDGGNTSGDAGSVGISGGAVTNGNGGGVYIFGSGGAGGTNQGGDVVILPGSTSGSGRIGQLQFFNSDLSSYYTWLDLSQVDLGAGNLQVTYPELNVSGDAAGTLMLGNTGRLTAKTSAQATVQTLTVPATDSSYLVSANANVTAFVAGTFNVVCAYTDETNTPRSLSLNFSSITGTLGIAVAAAGAFEGIPVHVRAKAGTTVTISTSGTFTSLTYNVEGNITPISTN
jgi:hypothetical protein